MLQRRLKEEGLPYNPNYLNGMEAGGAFPKPQYKLLQFKRKQNGTRFVRIHTDEEINQIVDIIRRDKEEKARTA